ncbi:MAG: GNAT family N-acetyltransferase [Nitriliruptoraceae bacterium]
MEPHAQVLRDGTTVTFRAVRADDDKRLLAMWGRTSPETRRRRFLGHFTLDRDNVASFVDLDPSREFAVVACRGRGDDERIVGVASYARDDVDAQHAEFAALVEDAEQGRGIGTALVRTVAKQAADDGIDTLAGDVLVDNVRMLNLIRELGLDYRAQADGGVVRNDMRLDLGAAFLNAVDADDRDAARSALRRFFAPQRIAVVGASRDPRAIGGLVFANLVQGHFRGVVYPVNPNADVIQSIAAYPNLAACPSAPDLVVVCVPAPIVADVIDEAGALGVAAVCVISAGFAETGPDGQRRQADLLERARAHGMRLVGPNGMGLMNGAEKVRMNATFSTTFPAPGRVSMSSQSGALGLAVLDHVDRLGLGIATFVSVGNKADVSGNDLLQYWEHDDDTDVVLMYLESFGNPRKFSRIARRVGRTKPIIAVKSGRTRAGERAASSHTAALAAGDAAVDALFRQTGVIRTDTLEEMFDVATLLSTQALPTGRNVAILTNAGGPAILAADALDAHGLDVPHLTDRTIAELRTFLPPEAGVSNPVDMIASASGPHYARAIDVLAGADEVDAIVVIFIPTGAVAADDITAAIAAAATQLGDSVPLIAVMMSSGGIDEPLRAAGVPTFTFPESAARALGRVWQYSRWRREPMGRPVTPDGLDRDAARALVDDALAVVGDDGWLDYDTAAAILDAYGITRARSEVAVEPDEGRQAAERLTGPFAVKLAAPIHKADIGGVELDIATADGVAAAITRMRQRLNAQGLGHHATAFVVQEMVDDGVEMMVGVTHEPSFGPVVVVGMGGTLVELTQDVSVRVTPLTDRDVDEMLNGLRMAPLLSGYRGRPAVDVAGVRDLLHRVNALVEDIDEIRDLDCNPVFVQPGSAGVRVVDVRMRLARSSQ